MPVYEYRCNNGHLFEVIQRMSDDPVRVCEECGAPVERVFHPVAVHFKGSGFYTTDYGSKSKARGGDGESGSGDSKPGEAKSGESKPGEAKSGESRSATGDAKAKASSGGE